MKLWFDIISELFVNLSAGWFAVVLIEPLISEYNGEAMISLTLRSVTGIVSLIIARILAGEARKI